MPTDPLASLLDIKATIMLADYASVANDKLTIVGGGWNVITGPAPIAIAALFEIPWQMANTKHHFLFELIDADGANVTDDNGEPLRIQGDFEVGRPAGVRSGTALIVPVAINTGPLMLAPGSSFVWRLYINDKTHDAWRLSFTTLS